MCAGLAQVVVLLGRGKKKQANTWVGEMAQLLFQRTKVWFPASMPGGSQLLLTLAPEGSKAFGLCGNLYSCTCMHTYMSAHYLERKQTQQWVLEGSLSCRTAWF